eukprot:TRINITY_DN1320_c0_g1_i2.p1 TRINITY_DN1320_c0_g1~~TRINITY_DN1320_c0_g1_i2.p1  ORF type:complete len:409 (-),score=63.30 TRINITY_DN1320_c0_g1_i2:36-1262(-)
MSMLLSTHSLGLVSPLVRRGATCAALVGGGMTWRLPQRFISSAGTYGDDEWTNITPKILEKLGRNLHQNPKHPLGIIKSKIEHHFQSTHPNLFQCYDNFSPQVLVRQNFDQLLIPEDHPSRCKTESYYYNKDTMLRCHTSAHQNELIGKGDRAFLLCGDVYRRDTVDATHYPVFHQMEGVRIFDPQEAAAMPVDDGDEDAIVTDLKHSLTGMVTSLFGNVECRWVDAHFPFTSPSLELEIYYQDEWLEVLGCGKIQPQILQNCGRPTVPGGWAFGLGLERLAMVLFNIPDIRLFWSQDPRFLSQFESGDIVQFQPFSRYPPCFKDNSMWVPETGLHENDFHAVVREVTDIAERVELVETFCHPKTGRQSQLYRITYRDASKSLTTEEANDINERVRAAAVRELGVELR